MEDAMIGRVVSNEDKSVTQIRLNHLVTWDHANEMCFNTTK